MASIASRTSVVSRPSGRAVSSAAERFRRGVVAVAGQIPEGHRRNVVLVREPAFEVRELVCSGQERSMDVLGVLPGRLGEAMVEGVADSAHDL